MLGLRLVQVLRGPRCADRGRGGGRRRRWSAWWRLSWRSLLLGHCWPGSHLITSLPLITADEIFFQIVKNIFHGRVVGWLPAATLLLPRAECCGCAGCSWSRWAAPEKLMALAGAATAAASSKKPGTGQLRVEGIGFNQTSFLLTSSASDVTYGREYCDCRSIT